MPVLPGAEPFAADPVSSSADAGVGVAPRHGITGSPWSMRPRGGYLARGRVAALDHGAPAIVAGGAASARRLDAEARPPARSVPMTGSGSSAGNTV